MSEGWRTAVLGEVCVFLNGLWKGEAPPFVRVGVIRNTNFAKDGILDDSDIAVLDVEAKKFATRRLQYGDIILEKSGGGPKQAVGRVVFFDKADGQYSFSNFTSAIRVVKTGLLDARYLHKYLHWLYMCGHTERMQSHSTGIRNLNGNAYKASEIRFPNLNEQKRIVAIIDEAFEGIDTAIANAEKNLANARELFNSYLNSVFAKKGEGWVRRRLEDTVEKTCSLSYGIVQPGEDVPGGLPVVRPTDLRSKIISLDGLKRIDPTLADAYKRTKLDGDELLLCVRGGTGSVSVAAKELAGSNVTRGIVPIRFDRSIVIQEFGYFAFISESVQSQIRAATYGAALMQINIRDLRKVTLDVPPRDVQKALLEKLSNISAQVECLASINVEKAAALAELKQAILHKAFSGEPTAHPEQALPEAAE